MLDLFHFFFSFEMRSQAIDCAGGCLFIGLIHHSTFSATFLTGAFCVRKVLTGKCRKALKLPFPADVYVPVLTPLQKCEILKSLVV